MKSIIQDTKECYLCGSSQEYGMNRIEDHHIFFGIANRKKSEEYGLKVWLCGNTCHRNGPNSPHRNKVIDNMLKAKAQQVFEITYGDREDFIKEFGKSYL